MITNRNELLEAIEKCETQDDIVNLLFETDTSQFSHSMWNMVLEYSAGLPQKRSSMMRGGDTHGQER